MVYEPVNQQDENDHDSQSVYAQKWQTDYCLQIIRLLI